MTHDVASCVVQRVLTKLQVLTAPGDLPTEDKTVRLDEALNELCNAELLEFCQKNLLVRVQKLLQYPGVNVNIRDTDGRTPLHLAASKGYTKIVEKLIQSKADVNTRDQHSFTPLLHAASEGFTDTVELLLQNGANVNEGDANNDTPLHLAAMDGFEDTVEALVNSEKTKIDALNKQDVTPLSFAAQYGFANVVTFLIGKNADVNVLDSYGNSPLLRAASYAGNNIRNRDLVSAKEVVKALLDKGAKRDVISKEGNTALHIAASFGNEEVVDLLLKEGFDVYARNCFYCTPRDLAAGKNIYGEFFSHIRQYPNIITKLDNAMQECLSKDESQLHKLIRENNFEAIKTMFGDPNNDVHALLNEKNCNQDTPLHYAAKNGNQPITSQLLLYRPDVNVKNKQHCTPLHLAAAQGNFKVVRSLIIAKAEKDVPDLVGNTPLHLAAINGNVQAAIELIRNEASTKIINKTKYTPLALAAEKMNPEQVEELQNKLKEIRGNL